VEAEDEAPASGGCGGGGGAGSKAPDGGVDQELWDVLLALDGVADPHAVNDCLADNSIFAVEDVVDMPHYRLKSFGVDPRSRKAIGTWVAANGGSEPYEPDDEEKAVDTPTASDGAGGGGDGAAAAGGDEAAAGDAAAEGAEGSGDAAGYAAGEKAGEAKAPEKAPFDWVRCACVWAGVEWGAGDPSLQGTLGALAAYDRVLVCEGL